MYAPGGEIESISAESGLVALHVHPAQGCDYLALWHRGGLKVNTP